MLVKGPYINQYCLTEETLHHLECINLVNDGINYQPQLVSRISAINSMYHPIRHAHFRWQDDVIEHVCQGEGPPEKVQKHPTGGSPKHGVFFSTFLSQFFEGEETSFTHSKRIETYNI